MSSLLRSRTQIVVLILILPALLIGFWHSINVSITVNNEASSNLFSAVSDFQSWQNDGSFRSAGLDPMDNPVYPLRDLAKIGLILTQGNLKLYLVVYSLLVCLLGTYSTFALVRIETTNLIAALAALGICILPWSVTFTILYEVYWVFYGAFVASLYHLLNLQKNNRPLFHSFFFSFFLLISVWLRPFEGVLLLFPVFGEWVIRTRPSFRRWGLLVLPAILSLAYFALFKMQSYFRWVHQATFEIKNAQAAGLSVPLKASFTEFMNLLNEPFAWASLLVFLLGAKRFKPKNSLSLSVFPGLVFILFAQWYFGLTKEVNYLIVVFNYAILYLLIAAFRGTRFPKVCIAILGLGSALQLGRAVSEIRSVSMEPSHPHSYQTGYMAPQSRDQVQDLAEEILASVKTEYGQDSDVRFYAMVVQLSSQAPLLAAEALNLRLKLLRPHWKIKRDGWRKYPSLEEMAKKFFADQDVIVLGPVSERTIPENEVKGIDLVAYIQKLIEADRLHEYGFKTIKSLQLSRGKNPSTEAYYLMSRLRAENQN